MDRSFGRPSRVAFMRGAGRIWEKAMKLLIEKIPDLQALYVKQLRLLLSAEEMIAIKSPFLLEAATDGELKKILGKHLQESERQAARLRDMIGRANGDPTPIKCKTVYALFDEAEDLVEDAAHEPVRNTALIAVARRIKHYELAFYDAVRQFAMVLGRSDDLRLLDESVREESDADRRLARIADRVNPTAKKVA
jgi:ferritin-like metal-binding protein YciE